MNMKSLALLLLSVFGLCSCHSSKNVSQNPSDPTIITSNPPTPQEEMPKFEVLARLNDFIHQDKVDAMVLEYEDGSIPADIRRGYSIHVYQDTVKLHIWSWRSDDVDIRKTYAIPGALRQLLAKIEPLDVYKTTNPEILAPGSSGNGGSGNDIRAYDQDDNCVFYASTYVCSNVEPRGSGHTMEYIFHQCVPENVTQMVEESRFPKRTEPVRIEP